MDENRFNQIKADLLSTDMVKVLNTMEQVVREGDWSALGLLTIAGENVTGIGKSLKITLPTGKLTFAEFQQRCIHLLQERLGVKQPGLNSREAQPRLFISYNHEDREAANALALELARTRANVFIDHWEMTHSDRILHRVENELHAADHVVALLSPRSAGSQWVRQELEIVIKKQESEGRLILICVLLADCTIPDIIAERPYYDLRKEQHRPMVVQAIINQIYGIRPFSQRVGDFLAKPNAKSPYNPQAQNNGRRLLQELARHPEMEVANHQKWLLWELFHRLLQRYTCTLKMGLQRSISGPSERYQFMIVDRWNEKISSIELSADEFARGLWQGEVDLLQPGIFASNHLKFVGSLGRFSSSKAYNPNVSHNSAEAPAERPMAPILGRIAEICESFDEGSRQSFLFDYQRLVHPGDWHRVKVVVGSTMGGRSLASSHLTRDPKPEDRCAVFELYDPFFTSLKYTQAFKGQLVNLWEGDVDLMSDETETLLGLA
jgi:hypothetical protein